MQGVILNAGDAQGLILGDDGVRYTFAQEEWQSNGAAPQTDMRVDFEVRGSNAANIYPIQSEASHGSSHTVPSAPVDPADPPPAESGRGRKWLPWTLGGLSSLSASSARLRWESSQPRWARVDS